MSHEDMLGIDPVEFAKRITIPVSGCRMDNYVERQSVDTAAAILLRTG
jgi:hypothetical protein